MSSENVMKTTLSVTSEEKKESTCKWEAANFQSFPLLL